MKELIWRAYGALEVIKVWCKLPRDLMVQAVGHVPRSRVAPRRLLFARALHFIPTTTSSLRG